MVSNINNVRENLYLPSFGKHLMALTLCQTLLWVLGIQPWEGDHSPYSYQANHKKKIISSKKN